MTPDGYTPEAQAEPGQYTRLSLEDGDAKPVYIRCFGVPKWTPEEQARWDLGPPPSPPPSYLLLRLAEVGETFESMRAKLAKLPRPKPPTPPSLRGWEAARKARPSRRGR